MPRKRKTSSNDSHEFVSTEENTTTEEQTVQVEEPTLQKQDAPKARKNSFSSLLK